MTAAVQGEVAKVWNSWICDKIVFGAALLQKVKALSLSSVFVDISLLRAHWYDTSSYVYFYDLGIFWNPTRSTLQLR